MRPGPERRSLFERMSEIANRNATIGETDQVRRPAATRRPTELPSRRLDD